MKTTIVRVKSSAIITVSLFLIVWLNINNSHAAECLGHGIELQVLGSGGPELQDKRASSSYLIWVNGKAKVLIDMGGGSALRFGESGANVADLDLILLTHLHADHTADLPALIKSSYFEERTRLLPIYGPEGNQTFPNTADFINELFGSKGAYRYLSDFLEPKNASYLLQAYNVELTNLDVKEVFNQAGIKASATQVIHGSVPALAWRIDIGDKSVVFSGDTNGNNGNLERLANLATIFVAHNAVPEGATGTARQLHMPPSVIGRIAKTANVTELVLSHRMLRTLGKEEQTLKIIKNEFTGKTVFTNDLDCFTL